MSERWQWTDQATSPFEARAAARKLAAVLEMLPLPSLILDQDGSALEVNRAWTALCGISSSAARGDGWLGAITESARAVVSAALHQAATDEEAGFADVRLAGPGQTRWSRWWWRPARPGLVIACVAELGAGALGQQLDELDQGPQDPAWSREYQHSRQLPDPAAGMSNMADALALVVHTLFGVGLELQSVAAQVDSPMSKRIQRVIDDLDDLVLDARSTAFGLGEPPR